MGDHVYKKIELVGTSGDSIEDAIENAVARAAESVRNMRWFEVVEARGQIQDGEVVSYQATIRIGFTLEE